MKLYLRKNLIPVLIEAVFILSFFFVPEEYAVYTNFLFYSLVAVYFLSQKSISIKEWKKQLSSGNSFWTSVMWTGIVFIIAFGLTGFLESAFSHVDTGMINLQRTNWLELVIFGISTAFLAPVTEELFFRQSMICFRDRRWLVMTIILSTFLYAVEHALKPFGIVISAIWAIPLVGAYVKTKNIYVPMTAHLIANVIGNGMTVVITAVNWIMK